MPRYLDIKEYKMSPVYAVIILVLPESMTVTRNQSCDPKLSILIIVTISRSYASSSDRETAAVDTLYCTQ